MKKFYEEPEMIIRNYVLPLTQDVCTFTGSEIDPDIENPFEPKTQNYFE